MTPEMIALQICIQAHKPVFLWGEPGIGKTSCVQALAEALDVKLWPLILSIREPSDQGGLPVIRPDGSVWMAPPRWAASVIEDEGGIVFLDELNVAPPTTQSSALRVVQEGWAGDAELPEATSFTGAGNPPETNPGAYDLTPAMANRLVHIKWPLDVTGWCEGMINGWLPPEVRKLPEGWKHGIPASRGTVASFIRKRGAKLLHAKPEDPGQAGQAWPSPRSYETMSILLAAAKSLGYGPKSEVARVLIYGCIGRINPVQIDEDADEEGRSALPPGGAGQEFINWYVHLDLRDPEDYLWRPVDTPLPRRQDQIMATLDAIAGAALNADYPQNARIERYYAAWKVLGRVSEDNMIDLAIPAAVTLGTALTQDATLGAIDRALPEECLAMEEMLIAAGVDFSRRV